jgi:hypothetical protein
MDGARIRAVIAQRSAAAPYPDRSRWVGDCTGDGEIGFLAGADLDVTRPDEWGLQLWNVRDTARPHRFPGARGR